MTTFEVCTGSPADLLSSTLCLDEVSKDARGELIHVDAELRECRDPECRSLAVEHALNLELSSHTCDSGPGLSLDGRLISKDMVTVFTGGSGERRGMHCATFRWRTPSVLIHGRLSGMTNEGTHREPAFDRCQPCDERGVMEGRLCGRVVRAGDAALTGAQVFGVYRLRFDPGERGGSGAVTGVVEGVVVRTCRTGRRCVDLDLVGDDTNPRLVGGLTIETRDLNGPTPVTSVVSWGARTGLHVWHETEVLLPQPVGRVDATVVQFAVAPTVRALDAAGATVASVTATAPQQVPETLVLAGPGITRLMVSSPQDEVLLQRLCWFTE